MAGLFYRHRVDCRESAIRKRGHISAGALLQFEPVICLSCLILFHKCLVDETVVVARPRAHRFGDPVARRGVFVDAAGSS